jgi:sugar phosphate isomerase/epimerase
LNFCEEIGAKVLVMPPQLDVDTQHWPANAQPPASSSDRDAMLLDALPFLAETAKRHNVMLTLEPVNRFETSYLRTLSHASRLCSAVHCSSLGITADFFHMQLEESNPADAIRQAGQWLRHIHVADNTRVEPGCGILDFRSNFSALHDIRYEGFVVIECRNLSGPADEVLPKSAQFLRRFVSEV